LVSGICPLEDGIARRLWGWSTHWGEVWEYAKVVARLAREIQLLLRRRRCTRLAMMEGGIVSTKKSRGRRNKAGGANGERQESREGPMGRS
jgi:hypothetical protein